MAKVRTPSRGEIWLVEFDPAVGAESLLGKQAVGFLHDEKPAKCHQ